MKGSHGRRVGTIQRAYGGSAAAKWGRAFEDRLIGMHDARTLPPGALWIDPAATCAPKRAGTLDDSWLRRRLNDNVLVKICPHGE